jgi:hypothetical protein
MTFTSPLDDHARKVATEALQDALTDYRTFRAALA